MNHLIDGTEVWKLHATHGFPIEFSLPLIAERGLVPMWDRFFEAAEADGTNLARLRDRVLEAVADSYPFEFAEGVRTGMPKLFADRGWE